jgi:hypothetical protein
MRLNALICGTIAVPAVPKISWYRKFEPKMDSTLQKNASDRNFMIS